MGNSDKSSEDLSLGSSPAHSSFSGTADNPDHCGDAEDLGSGSYSPECLGPAGRCFGDELDSDESDEDTEELGSESRLQSVISAPADLRMASTPPALVDAEPQAVSFFTRVCRFYSGRPSVEGQMRSQRRP